jgi:hypothetical protein
MATPAPPLPAPARRRIAALGLVGSAMVAVPLVQVLRFESAEMQAVVAQQASLDPIARAVAVQLALLAHRDTAGQVLRGQAVLEPERQVRQAEVDIRLIDLGSTLDVLHSYRAIDEAQVLAQDWAGLAERVSTQQISADASDAAHRLRVEQAVQVMDLVADAGGLTQHAQAAAFLKQAQQVGQTHSATRTAAQRAQHYQELLASGQAVKQTLARQQATLQQQHRAVLAQMWALMAALAALAAGLAWSLFRSNKAGAAPNPEHALLSGSTGEQTSALKAATHDALAKLRQPGEQAAKDKLPTPQEDA